MAQRPQKGKQKSCQRDAAFVQRPINL